MSAKTQIEIRLLTESEAPAAMRLQRMEGWNQTERDWRRLLQLAPAGCFAAWIEGHLVATVTTSTYGRDLAWVGMMLVDPEYRRRGIATRLLSVALDYLRAAGVAAIKLDATPAGRPIYEAIGFAGEGMIERWETIAQSRIVNGDQPLNTEIRQQIYRLDRAAYSADRSSLLDTLIADSSLRPQVVMTPDGRLQAYALARRGLIASYVGPIIAQDEATALTLLDRMLAKLEGEKTFLDFHPGCGVASEALAKRGFVKQRELVRMRYGSEEVSPTAPLVFAIAGPELG